MMHEMVHNKIKSQFKMQKIKHQNDICKTTAQSISQDKRVKNTWFPDETALWESSRGLAAGLSAPVTCYAELPAARVNN